MENQKCPCAKQSWVWLLIIGILTLALAVYVSFQPMEGYIGLAVLFGWMFIFVGVGKIIMSLSHTKTTNGWGWILLYGIISLVLGIYLVANIQLTLASLPVIFAFWILIQGAFLVSNAISRSMSSDNKKGWGWILVGGLLAILAAFMLMFNPVISFLTIMIWTAVGLYVAGFSYIMMAMKVKKCKC